MKIEEVLGVQELAICLATPDSRGYNLVPLLHGGAGIGKSSTVCSLIEGAHVEVLSASLYDPADFAGYPVPSADHSCIDHIPPRWATNEKLSCLLLDDITCCMPQTQNALMRLILEKRIGSNYVIPPNVKMIASANPFEILGGGGHPLSLPLCNRMVHVHFEMPASTFANALENGGFPKVRIPEIDPKKHAVILKFWNLKFASFIRRYPSMISSKPDQDHNSAYQSAFASPRSIEMALRLAATADILGLAPTMSGKNNPNASDVFLKLLQGSIGTAVAVAFSRYILEEEAPTAKDVLSGKESIDFSKWAEDRVYLYFSSLASELIRMQSSLGDVELHIANLAMCKQISALNSLKRIDCCYATVRHLCSENWLTKASMSANRIGETKSFSAAMNDAFKDDSQLAQYVEAIEADGLLSSERKARRGRVSA